MATNFPDTSVNNPGTSAPWADGDIFDDTANSGLIYYWYDPVWKTKAEGDIAAGDLTVSSLNSGPLAGFRNHIINGDFRVNQRGSETYAASNSYTVDRWKLLNGNLTRSAAPASSQFEYQVTSDLSPSYFLQPIETLDKGIFAQGSTVTFSWYSTKSTPSIFSAVWSDNTAGSANDVIVVAGNSSVSTTQIDSNYYRHQAQVLIDASPVATNNCLKMTIELTGESITGVQLEPGPIATPFEHRPIGTELALCQRYFIFSNDYSTFYPAPAGGGMYNIYFPNTMRLEPTMSFDNPADIGTVVSGKTQFFFNTFANASPYYDSYTADAEL